MLVAIDASYVVTGWERGNRVDFANSDLWMQLDARRTALRLKGVEVVATKTKSHQDQRGFELGEDDALLAANVASDAAAEWEAERILPSHGEVNSTINGEAEEADESAST